MKLSDIKETAKTLLLIAGAMVAVGLGPFVFCKVWDKWHQQPRGPESPSHIQARKVFGLLKAKLAKNDREGLAEAFDYPCVIQKGCEWTEIRSKKDMVAHIDSIFDSKIRAIVDAQDPAGLFDGETGVMIGERGDLWVESYTDRLHVLRISSNQVDVSSGTTSAMRPFDKALAGVWVFDPESLGSDAEARDLAKQFDGQAFTVDQYGIRGDLLKKWLGHTGGDGVVWTEWHSDDGNSIGEKGSLSFAGNPDAIEGGSSWLRECLGNGNEIYLEVSKSGRLCYYADGGFIFFHKKT